MNERRRKLIPVSRLLMQDIAWRNGAVVHFKCTQGLPEDAVFIGMTYDHMRDVYYLCYQSAEWDEVPDGEMLPVFNIQFLNLYTAPFLERAADILSVHYDAESTRWLEEYRAFKERAGWPE